MNEFESAEMREAAIVAALSDPTSDYYKKMVSLLRDATALHEQNKVNGGSHVTIPFCVESGIVAQLEQQFSVNIRTTAGCVRSRNTERVAALMSVLDSSLIEHSESGGKSVLYVDGDVVTMAAMGLEGRTVERTHSHARLASSYVEEDMALERIAVARSGSIRVNSQVLLNQMFAGGGVNISNSLSMEGRRYECVAINHLKTPVGITQVANYTKARGRMALGVIPFQPAMRYLRKGRLECFPGWFYVEREADMITLVPDEDPTMSISHPYSSLMSFIDNNSVVVDGLEFLCEKFSRVSGFLYYTLIPVNGLYESPETLRSFYYDLDMARVSKVTFPEVKLSAEGVPVGYTTGEVLIPTSRLEKICAKAMIINREIVTPADVMVVLANENNMVLNTMDSAHHVERLDEMDETRLSVAIALNVNWRRHEARGTFKTLLGAVRTRHSASDVSILHMARLALCAWWQSPNVRGDTTDGLPVNEVVDWCGNDFSVVIERVDPWVEISSVDPFVEDGTIAVNHGFPKVKKRKNPAVIQRHSFPGCGGGKTVFSSASAAVDQTPAAGFLVETAEGVVSSDGFVLTHIKEQLCDKMIKDTYAVRGLKSSGEREVLVGKSAESKLWAAVPDVDPVSAIRNDLDDIVGGLPERDALQTGFALAEVEENRTTRGVLAINDLKRNLPKPRYVRRPVVDAGVEGQRVQTSAALTAALFKRNIGIPDNQGAVDLDLTPELNAQRLAEVCFVDDWQSIVNKHLDAGMWDPDVNDIEDYVGNLDEVKVKQMLKEFFQEGYVSLESWMLMAKGKIKPSREEGCEAKVDHSQTIMYLESSNTNGMYSSILRRVKKCFDEALRPNVRVNAQWGPVESEAWYNTIEPLRKACGRTYNYTVDSKAFDRSQGHPCVRTEMAVHRMLGLTADRYKIWEQTHGKKKAMNMAFGIIAYIVLSGVSGLWSTLFRNGVVQTVAVIIASELTRNDVVTLEVKGDDVDLETKRPILVETAVERMSLAFNLTSKFNTTEIRYFCKKFRIKKDGWWYEISDPWARVQTVCTPVILESGSSPSLADRWQSLKAELIHYDNDILLCEVAEAARKFYGLKIAPYGMVRGLAALVADKNKFMKFFGPPEFIF